MFDDSFVDHLFELVEQTRGMQDETFNYSVIKLIVRPFVLLLQLLLFASRYPSMNNLWSRPWGTRQPLLRLKATIGCYTS